MNEEITIERLGNIYGEQFGTGFAGKVWDSDKIAPTIKVESGGGGRVPMIIEDMYANREPRVYSNYSPAIRSERSGLKVVEGENYE